MTSRTPIAVPKCLLLALVLGAGLTACNKSAATTQAAPDSAQTAASASVTAGPVATAVAVAQAMKSFPAKGDSILTAFHLTANEFAALMKRIAADSTMSEEYRRGTA